MLAYRTQQQVMGELRTIVVTYNPKLAEAQERGIRLTVEHKTPLLNKLAEKRKVTEAAMTLAVKRILVGQYLREVVKWRVADGRFQWWLDEEGLNHLRRERLGKKILFTDQHEWTTGWGAPGRMDTRIGECSMKPEVTFEHREEATQGLYA